MKTTLQLFIIFIISTITAYCQPNLQKVSLAIMAEGKKLYQSEMASWYGTDIFREKYLSKKENTGGYFSYVDNAVAKCLFFSKAENPRVILTIAFDSTYNLNTAIVDSVERDFSGKEKDLYLIRQATAQALSTDTLFRLYKHTNFNIIPLVENGEKKVYVLTAPENNGVVLIGNDYLLTFDNQNKIANKKRLHKTLISIPFNGDPEAIGTHTHLKEMDEYITASDICTLMLYGKFAKWKQHYVLSDKYVSIWDCKTEKLTILSKKVWDKINKDQEKKGKN